jgi:catalase-peroxidase
MMTTADIALKTDPAYLEISKRFRANPEEFETAFAKAWFKLTHRDMGPRSNYLGAEVPSEVLVWQDPLPEVDHPLVNHNEIASLKKIILASGLTVSEMVTTAWASASTYRGSDKRGGANGARIALAPQKDWEVNNPAQLAKVLDVYRGIQKEFNAKGETQISLADLIVLGGAAGIEEAGRAAGKDITVPFTPGRSDATQEQTDVESFGYLEPFADGFRNYLKEGLNVSAEELLIDRTQLMGLSIPEMAVLLAGMRVMDTNYDDSNHGVFTANPGSLTSDFFVNILDMMTTWEAISDDDRTFSGRHRISGDLLWTGTRADLIFGSNTELRAIAEVYASDDAKDKFVTDFVAAWTKVMNADR